MVDVASLLSRTYHVNKITDGNDQPWHMTMENLLFIKLLNMLTWIRGNHFSWLWELSMLKMFSPPSMRGGD